MGEIIWLLGSGVDERCFTPIGHHRKFSRNAGQASFLLENMRVDDWITVKHDGRVTSMILAGNGRELGSPPESALYRLFPGPGGRSSSTRKQEDALNTAHNRCPARISISSSAAPVIWQRRGCPQSRVTA